MHVLLLEARWVLPIRLDRILHQGVRALTQRRFQADLSYRVPGAYREL